MITKTNPTKPLENCNKFLEYKLYFDFLILNIKSKMSFLKQSLYSMRLQNEEQR